MLISFETRFWNKVNKKSKNECWEWLGAKYDGYGVFSYNGKSRRAHRISYKITYGEFNNLLLVLHKCDNPSCVNPSHLFLGTTQDNTKDRERKGRGTAHKRFGELHPIAKLTNKNIKKIHNLYRLGHTQKNISKIFNVCQGTIHNVISRKLWKHIII